MVQGAMVLGAYPRSAFRLAPLMTLWYFRSDEPVDLLL